MTVDLNGVEVVAAFFSSETVSVTVDDSWPPGNVDVGLTNPDGQRAVFPAGLSFLDPEAILAAEHEELADQENGNNNGAIQPSGCTSVSWAGSSYGVLLLTLLASRRRSDTP